jgi:hypothetical protein
MDDATLYSQPQHSPFTHRRHWGKVMAAAIGIVTVVLLLFELFVYDPNGQPDLILLGVIFPVVLLAIPLGYTFRWVSIPLLYVVMLLGFVPLGLWIRENGPVMESPGNDPFVIIHGLLHFSLRNHDLIEFESWFSRFWIFGGSLLGGLHLVLVL